LSKFDLLEVIADVAPSIAVGLLGHAREQLRQQRDRDMRVDAMGAHW